MLNVKKNYLFMAAALFTAFFAFDQVEASKCVPNADKKRAFCDCRTSGNNNSVVGHQEECFKCVKNNKDYWQNFDFCIDSEKNSHWHCPCGKNHKKVKNWWTTRKTYKNAIKQGKTEKEALEAAKNKIVYY